MKSKCRYFVNVKGFSFPSAYVMIDSKGQYWVYYVNGLPPTQDVHANLNTCMHYVKEGTWKEITQKEALNMIKPRNPITNRPLKPEEFQIGMTIIGHSTTDMLQDRSYIGSTYEIVEIQLPFIFAKEIGGFVLFKDDIRTIDTRRYLFMERATSKPLPSHEEIEKLREQVKAWEANAKQNNEYGNKCAQQAIEATKKLKAIELELKNAVEANMENQRVIGSLDNQLRQLKQIKKMIEGASTIIVLK